MSTFAPEMKKSFLFFLALAMVFLTADEVRAQESQTAYNFLRVPMSAHAAALGGENVSVVEDDPALIFNNPALLASVSDKQLGLNFMTYMQGAIIGGASYSRVASEKASWAVMAQYVNYGTMKETTAENIQTGTFSANDIALQGAFSYQLGRNIVGGITAKYIASYIGRFSSVAAGVDLGINYYNAEADLSVSAVAKNLGGQIKAFEEDYDKMPMDLQVGLTKSFPNMPFRASVTLVGLNDWKGSLADHLVFGADLKLGEQFYVAGGYNFRRAKEMKIPSIDEEKESSHGAGLSLGAGLQLEKVKFNVGWAKYHVSSNSLVFNLACTL